ncbi:MBL fold metallo-hydrolase [Microvirga sp. VF16]|uniref:MBL fold metallo-hydrolase n=1 Tax=Microvirga sp. VF16 TaxID=2807101 RepID=UPI00193D9915|nr:MBL fold metallo-hydrolase [Microvirga sp. VF16]QRM32387.1 MBL fold metallo-hydrolase [Microvirga sp. VF16]
MTEGPFLQVRFLGVAAYEMITQDGRRVLLDPFLTGNPACPVVPEEFDRVDLIMVTHAAKDHLGDTARIALKSGAPVICGGEVRAYLEAHGVPASQIRVTAWGMRLEVAGFEVQTLECRHCSFTTLPDGSFVSGIPLAFLLDLNENIRWYHPGDTSLFYEMKLQGKLYRPTIGSLGIANPAGIPSNAPGKKLTTDLSPREGVLAAQWLGLNTVLPCHYTSLDDELVRAFMRCVDDARVKGETVPEVLLLEPGEWLRIAADGSMHSCLTTPTSIDI